MRTQMKATAIRNDASSRVRLAITVENSIALTDLQKSEGTAQACDIACSRHLRWNEADISA
jgi:hypothetical protein